MSYCGLEKFFRLQTCITDISIQFCKAAVPKVCCTDTKWFVTSS